MSTLVAPGHLVGGKYRLLRLLAGGGMGTIWVAQHEKLDTEVAVKFIAVGTIEDDKGQALARFEREAKASAQLRSNHIVRVFDYGNEDGHPYMVMELLEGEDLGETLRRCGPLSVAELAPMFAQVCKGCEVAHDAGFVHRDLKPGNVFITREGGEEVIKLLDFGIARETKSKLVDERTNSGVVVGSPHHMSPEQAHGMRVDHRSDLWALGVLVYRALTDQKPFDGESLTAVLLAVVSAPIPSARDLIGELPPDIERFFERALCRDVNRRFQRAGQMSAVLTAIAEGRDVTALLEAVPKAAGRDEATLPSMPAAQKGEAPSERTVAAVTSGVLMPVRRTRALPWIGLALAGIVAAFFLGRSGGDDVEPATSVTSAATSPPASSTMIPSTTTAAASVSVSVTPSEPAPKVVRPAQPSSNPPISKPPRRPAFPKPVVKPKKKPKPKIDPFTGLPIE